HHHTVKPDTTLNKLKSTAGLDPVEAARILRDLGDRRGLVDRREWLSKYFLGRPYIEGSLGGGPDSPEELRASLDAFDCVTYIEVVLALALSQTTNEFSGAIRRIRYKDGTVDWFHRNHYMVDWARNNEELGMVLNLTTGPFTSEKTCTLDLIAGIPARTTSFRYFPTKSLNSFAKEIETGDLIFFVSTRSTLDVFHTGLLVKREPEPTVRHATRAANAV